MAVSYTHLDVYKRQLLMRTIFSQNGIVNTLLLNAGIIEKAIPFWSNTMLARVMVVAVSYTHLDVYKRQVP